MGSIIVSVRSIRTHTRVTYNRTLAYTPDLYSSTFVHLFTDHIVLFCAQVYKFQTLGSWRAQVMEQSVEKTGLETRRNKRHTRTRSATTTLKDTFNVILCPVVKNIATLPWEDSLLASAPRPETQLVEMASWSHAKETQTATLDVQPTH